LKKGKRGVLQDKFI